MVEIVRLTLQGIKDHPRRAIVLGVAGAMLTVAGYLNLNTKPTVSPDLNPQNPQPTQPLGGTEPSSEEVPTVVLPQSTQNGRGSGSTPPPGGQNNDNCITTLGLPIRKNILTPLQGYKCIGRGPNGESVWERKGKIYITTRTTIDPTLIDP